MTNKTKSIYFKYSLILYLEQLIKKPCDIDIWYGNRMDETIDSEEIREFAIKNGYIIQSEGLEKLKNIISTYTVPDIKTLLRKNNLKISGRKKELIDRLIENVDNEELNKEFSGNSYTVTDKGLLLISENPQVKYYENNLRYLSLKHYNSFYEKNKDIGNMDDIAIQCLEYVNEELIDTCQWFRYSWYNVRGIAHIYYENKQYYKALLNFTEVFICQINFWGDSSLYLGNFYINDFYIKKYIDSILKLELSFDQLEKIFNECCSKTKIPLIIIPKEEMFKYLVRIVNGENIDTINSNIKERIHIPKEFDNHIYFNSKKEETKVINIIKSNNVFR